MPEMFAVKLHFRVEGEYWRAYVTDDGDDHAHLIGSIALGVCTKDPAIEQGFRDLMTQVVQSSIKAIGGFAVVVRDRN